MKHTFMKLYRKEFSIVRMSKVLGVSKNGFYSWLVRPLAQQKLRKVELQAAIKSEYTNHEGMSGSPLMTKDLNDSEKWKNISRTRVAREMNFMDLKSKHVKNGLEQLTQITSFLWQKIYSIANLNGLCQIKYGLVI